MILDRLELIRFRCHRETILSTEFSPRVLVRGPNGSGKTTCLEAVHLLASGIGLRTRRDAEFAQFGERGWRVSSVPAGGPRLWLKWTVEGGREARIDETPLASSGLLIGRLRMTLLKPEDIRLIEGGPADRRQFLDVLLCQDDPGYLASLRRWRRAHKQVLAAMVSGARSLRAFLQAACDEIPMLVSARGRACAALEAAVNARAGTMGFTGSIGVTYRPALPKMASELASSGDWTGAASVVAREAERLLAVGQPSPWGPGRDEVVFTLDGVSLRTYGSQGQKRIVTLLLRLAEASVLSRADDPALVLVDDVTGELDADRFSAFLGLLDALPGQVWVAATGTKNYEERWSKWVRFDIKGGALQGAETR